jgi:Zn-dependent peptidase ImmA (M78 family)
MSSKQPSTDGIAPLPDPQKVTERLLRRVEITEPPIQVSKIIAIWKNLQVVEEDLDGAGYLLPLGRLGAEILVNKKDSDERRLFTIAHELGHWVLGLICERKTGEFKQPVGVPKAILEKWCDEFATNLLMPAALVRSHLSRIDKPGLVDAIIRASDKFRVSREAFFIRAWEVQRIQVAVVRLGATLSLEKSYADAQTRVMLADILSEPNVFHQVEMSRSMIFFTLQYKTDTVSVSGRALDGNKVILSLAWPPSTNPDIGPVRDQGLST